MAAEPAAGRGWSALFHGVLEPYRETLVLRAPDRRAVPAADLLDGARFDRLVEPFLERHAGADRRAVVSLWTQWYFAALVVPAVGVILRTGRELPLGVRDVDVLLAEDDHRPTGFRLPHGGGVASPPRGPDDAFAPFRTLVWDHLAPLVEAVAAGSGLATGLLWSNAGTYFDWAVHELGVDEGATSAVVGAGRRLLDAATWPNGRENPLHEPVVRGEGHAAASSGRRRVCCLRYLVPGFERCEGRCPLPE